MFKALSWYQNLCQSESNQRSRTSRRSISIFAYICVSVDLYLYLFIYPFIHYWLQWIGLCDWGWQIQSEMRRAEPQGWKFTDELEFTGMCRGFYAQGFISGGNSQPCFEDVSIDWSSPLIFFRVISLTESSLIRDFNYICKRTAQQHLD